MSAAHTATLPSTAAILGALRDAHTCRQGLLAGQTPARQLSDPLPHLPTDLNVCHYKLHLSPDTQLCAVSLYGDADDYCSFYTGLHVYETLTGRLVCTLDHTYSGLVGYMGKAHAVQWQPDSAHLSVVHGLNMNAPRSVVVYEAATARIINPAWNPAATRCLAQNTNDSAILSPDGKLLLCRCCDSDNRLTLHVLELSVGRVLASALVRYSGGCSCASPINSPGVLWHPSSQGLLLSGCSLQLDAQPLQLAGLAVGWCFPPAHAGKGSAFSPSGDLVIAFSPAGRGQRSRGISADHLEQYLAARVPLAILQCVQQPQEHGLQEYILTCLFMVEAPASDILRGMWCPLPCGAEAVLLDDAEGVVLISPSGQPLGQRSASHIELPEEPCSACSPCGQFYPVHTAWQKMPLVLHCRTGKVYSLPSWSDEKFDICWHPSGSLLALYSGFLSEDCPFSLLRFHEL